jgi:hypothetical protein
MANPSTPFGLRPLLVSVTGSPCEIAEYTKRAADSTAIYSFDPVQKYASGDTSNTGLGVAVPGITSAPANATPGSAFYLGASINYGAASTLTMHYVVDSIDALFMIMSTSASVTTANAAGKNANFTFGTTGSATTKLSGAALDQTTVNTTSSLDLRIMRLSNISPNAAGAYAIVEVTINKHLFAQASAGV